MRSARYLRLHDYTNDEHYRRAVNDATHIGPYIKGSWASRFLGQLQAYRLKLLPEAMIRLDLTRGEFRNIGMMPPLPPKKEEHLMYMPCYMVWEWDYSYEEPNGLRADALEIDCFHPRLSLHYVDPDEGSYFGRDPQHHQGSWLCI